MTAFKGSSRYFFQSVHCLIWVLIAGLFLPASSSSAGDVQPWNRHVHERLNSPERAKALEEAARSEAEARARFERSAAAVRQPVAAPAPSANAPAPAAITVAQDTSRSVEGFRPKSVTEVLFNYAAGFAGVPGLTPQRGVDGYNEGLGFHQDGTVRRVGGGVDSANGPSDQGQRANAYMKSGLTGSTAYGAGNVSGVSPYGASGLNASGLNASGQNASGLNSSGSGYASTIWEPGYDAATGMHWRGDPTRGGRISGFGANGSSRELSDFDPMSMALDRGLNYGAGFVNSMGEAAISGLVDGGRARLNFYLDREGYFSGEGDALLPFYDSARTTVFTQIGARSMSAEDTQDRWIGNFGLGQRWFFALGSAAPDRQNPALTPSSPVIPAQAGIQSSSLPASGEKALAPRLRGGDGRVSGGDGAEDDFDPNFMLGYNAFFDYDFTRSHQRGGIGIEAQYDWLRLASNYYFPLSTWRGSYDFDSRFVKERPAEGWDARVKAYLPFYRNVAITGAYTQWYGDHVGMFGASDLEKDPKVWSYGVEYTPIPLVSGFITQRSTERGRTDTEFGLNFTYHFDMPWEQQISHAKVAELRTVSGSRHEFVDRENRIILEYKAKNSYRIEYLGLDGARGFLFRIRDGFGEYMAGQTVRVTASGAYLAQAGAAPAIPADPATLAGPQGFFAQAVNFLDDLVSMKAAFAADLSRTYTTDGQGRFWVQLEPSAPDPATVTIQAGDNSQTFTLAGGGGSGTGYSLVFGTVSGNTASFTPSQTATIPVTLMQNGVAYTTQTQVTWSVVSADNSANLAVTSANQNLATGLAWGSTAKTQASTTDESISGANTSTTSTTDGTSSIELTDIMGERTVTVQASVTIGGQTVTNQQAVTFGAGPLSKLKIVTSGTGVTNNNGVGFANWTNAVTACGGTSGDPSTWTSNTGYLSDSNLPIRRDLVTVSGGSGRPAAYLAAGWPGINYWTGVAFSADIAFIVDVGDGDDERGAPVSHVDDISFVCLR